MKQRMIFILAALTFASYGAAKRIELIHFNQLQTMPRGDFIPVYTAVNDFKATYKSSGKEASELLLLKSIKKTATKQAEINDFDTLNSNSDSKTEAEDYEDLNNNSNYEGRNFQPLPVTTPDLRNFPSLPVLGTPEPQNFQTQPAYQIPELPNFQIPEIASSALRRLQPTPNNVESSSGRTFKHFLLLKGLLGNGGGGNGFGSGTGFGTVPTFFVVNTPVNVTNVNNNTLTNTPAAAAAAGGAAGGGADDPNAGLRINYIGIPQTQLLPMQMPMQTLQLPTPNYQHQPTPVYQQRQAVNTAHPTFAVAMLNIPGTSSFVPYSMPQYQSSLNRNTRGGWSNASKNQNPWSTLANNLRGMQFL